VIGLGVGILLLWHSLGAAVGSWLGGHVYDTYGEYMAALVACSVLCGLAAAVTVLGGVGTNEPLRRGGKAMEAPGVEAGQVADAAP
jgi:predicted MFS family arabinose efflux permease